MSRFSCSEHRVDRLKERRLDFRTNRGHSFDAENAIEFIEG